MADVAPADDQSTPRAADRSIAIEKIQPNPDQPRRQFDDAALSELAASISERGIIQPLILRPDPSQSGMYQIVAGERRWRAAQIARLHEVPALIRDYTDTEVLEVAIIENIQRSDLNPIDEAAGYRQLMDRFGHTQEQLATVLGKSRSHIANLLRLLTLPDDVTALLIDGRLTAGHARALVGHEDAVELARRIVKGGLSVREAEKLARADAAPRKTAGRSRPEKDADTVQIEQELAATLGMAVSIDHKPGQEGGTLTLRYRDLGQLDDLLRALSGG
jgi:ParB family chromosome partitioning protein